MADVKISALTAATSAGGSDQLVIAQSGVSKSLTINALFTAPVQQSYEDFTSIADPSAPSSGILRVYAKNIAGRMLPKWIGPSGINTQFQAALDGNGVTMWLPGTGTTAAINFGVSWTVGATQAHPAIAGTNFMTSIRRATYTTTTTAGNASGILSSAPVAVYQVGTAGIGGFFFSARFGVLTFSSTMQMWVGLSAQTTALAGNPSAVANTICVGKDSGDTNWQIMTVSSTPTATKTDTGKAVAAGGTGNVFDVFFFNPPGTSTLTARFVDITTGTVYADNVALTGNLPTSSGVGTALVAHAYCRNSAGGAGSAVAMFLSKIYIETDN